MSNESNATPRVRLAPPPDDEYPYRRDNQQAAAPGDRYDRAVVEVPADAGGAGSADHALAGGDPQRIGWFRFYFEDERWEWSPQVETMHGYAPGTVRPTTELVLSHKHPDDIGRVAATLESLRTNATPFSTRHRIIDTRGQTHEVVVVGSRLYDYVGQVIGSHGFYVDITPALRRELDTRVAETVSEITQSRACIEQAKGMLMAIYRIDADTAFALLRWRSQECNVKLRAIAAQIVADFSGLESGDGLPPRETFDGLLMTAHERVAVPPDGVNDD